MKYFNINEIRDSETVSPYGELVSPSEMAKEEEARIKEKINLGIPKSKHAKRPAARKIFAGLAAAVLIFCTFACTAEVFGWDIRLSKYLSATEEDIRYAEKKGISTTFDDEEFSTTSGSITLNVKQALADESICYILVEAKLPEDAVYLSSNFLSIDIESMWEANTAVRYVQPVALTTYEDIAWGNDTVSFFIFCRLDPYDGDTVPIDLSINQFTYSTIWGNRYIAGDWSIKGNINKSSESITISPELVCQLTGAMSPSRDMDIENFKTSTEGIITNVTLTPLSVKLDVVADVHAGSNLDYICAFHQPLDHNGIELGSMTVYLKDGRSIVIDNWDFNLSESISRPSGDAKKRLYTYDICLKQIVDIESIEKIDFLGTQIVIDNYR